MNSQLILGDFAIPTDPAALSQWFTPRKLAERMVKWAGIEPGMHVLEPSAGSGALVRPLLEAGATVTAVEIDPRWADKLKKEFSGKRLTVVCADFMTWEPTEPIDTVVSNPPYEKGLDARFIARSMGMIANPQWPTKGTYLIRTHALHGRQRYLDAWSKFGLARLALCINRPDFGGDYGAQFEYVIADVRPKPIRQSRRVGKVEWWRV